MIRNKADEAFKDILEFEYNVISEGEEPDYETVDGNYAGSIRIYRFTNSSSKDLFNSMKLLEESQIDNTMTFIEENSLEKVKIKFDSDRLFNEVKKYISAR